MKPAELVRNVSAIIIEELGKMKVWHLQEELEGQIAECSETPFRINGIWLRNTLRTRNSILDIAEDGMVRIKSR